jgi:hypothetical protein
MPPIRQTPVVGSDFELLQRVDVEVFVDPLGHNPADAGNRTQDCYGIRLPAKPIQHREPPGNDEIVDGASQALSDPRQAAQSFDAFFGEHLPHRSPVPADGARRMAVGLNAKRVRVLLFEKPGHFFQAFCDFDIER